MTRTDSDPFSEFINHHLYLSDEVFTPIETPAPTDRRWHYAKYQADSTVNIYSQPNIRYDSNYDLRPTNGYAHAMLRYLPDIRPGWTAIALSLGNPIVGYVRNGSAHFRPSSGVYEYLLMLMFSALIIMGLSVLIFLYAIPQSKVSKSTSAMPESSWIEQHVERFIARLETALLPLQ